MDMQEMLKVDETVRESHDLHLGENGTVYFLDSGERLPRVWRAKIGRTRGPLEIRINQFDLPDEASVLGSWDTSIDVVCEKFAHSVFTPYRIPGEREWFVIPRPALEIFMENELLKQVEEDLLNLAARGWPVVEYSKLVDEIREFSCGDWTSDSITRAKHKRCTGPVEGAS